jgi:hypothetical protein
MHTHRLYSQFLRRHLKSHPRMTGSTNNGSTAATAALTPAAALSARLVPLALNNHAVCYQHLGKYVVCGYVWLCECMGSDSNLFSGCCASGLIWRWKDLTAR